MRSAVRKVPTQMGLSLDPKPVPWRGRRSSGVSRHRRGAGRAGRLGRAALGLAALGIFGLALVALAATIAVTAAGGDQTQAAAAPVTDDEGWITLHSTAPNDILAAVSQSPLLAETAGDGSSPAPAQLGMPVLVRGLPARSGQFLPDVYVVPLLDRAGRATQAAEAVLNSAHTALHVTTVVTFTRAYPSTLVALSAHAAVGRLNRARHLGLHLGAAPTLVYFPVDAQAQASGQLAWRAGGEDPADPVWLIPAADGHEYVVGTNGAVYTLAQLPFAASA